MAFSHLHIHSRYSLFDGMIKIPELFKRAEGIGIKAIALTDHGNMYGIPEFLAVARDYPNIKPIVGCELYIYDDRRYHLIALAKNLTGYRNLCKLVTIASMQPTPQGIMGKANGYKNRLHRSDLAKHKDGLIITSACIGGDIPQAILEDDIPKAKSLVNWYKSVFGEDFYLEVSQHESKKPAYSSDLLQKQIKANSAIFEIAQELGVKVLATNDVHFLYAEDALAHDVRLCISTRSKITDSKRFQYTGEEYLKSEAEMLAIFPDHPEAIATTMDVADKIERFDIQSPPLFPCQSPDSHCSSDDYLSAIAREALRKRHNEDLMRLERELEVVRQKGCANYFLMLRELIGIAKERGIVVGPGRGAAPSMTLSYALGLTDLHPSRFGLLSEHCFHKQSAAAYPDMDFDLSPTCEGGKSSLEVMYEICTEKFGPGHVAKVLFFGELNRFSAVKHVFRAMGCSREALSKIVKALPKSVRSKESLASMLESENAVREWYEQAGRTERLAFEISDKLTGLILEPNVHSSAIAVCSRPLSDFMPIQMLGTHLVGQYDVRYIESLGVIKLDFLTLRVLDSLKAAPDDMPFDAPKVYEYLANSDVHDIFMLEAGDLSKWVKLLRPANLNHLAALEALYRPWIIKYLSFYIEAKTKSLYYESAPEFCRDILEPTYGLLLYKEQAMLIAKRCLFTDKEADDLCKVLRSCGSADGKGGGAILEYKKKFLMGADSIGISREDANKAWALMLEFGPMLYSYSQALSHATLSYKCAWLKTLESDSSKVLTVEEKH